MAKKIAKVAAKVKKAGKQINPSSSVGEGLEFNPVRLADLLADFKQRRVLVIGDIGVDLYTIGSVDRISPEAPVPIVVVERQELKLGLAGNVADNVKSLRGDPILIGVMGKDAGAKDLKGLLQRAKISAHGLIVDVSRPTVLKERIVSERQQIVRLDYESTEPVSATIRKRLFNQFKKMIGQADVVILEDYRKGVFDQELTQALFRVAKAHGKPVLVDPKGSIGLYRGATLIKPNLKEAEKLTGISIVDDESLLDAGSGILEQTGAKFAVISRGREGMAVFSRKSKGATVSIIPTYAREVYDVSGAGDTVMAVLALSLASGAEIEEAAILSNLAAGIVVGKRGTATVAPAEILQELERMVAGLESVS